MFRLIVINEQTGKTEVNERFSAICAGTCDEHGGSDVLGFTHANAIDIAKAVICAEDSAKTLKKDPRIRCAYNLCEIDKKKVIEE